MEPYQVIVTGATIWLAPVGESFPDVDATPGGNWAKLGTNGIDEYSEDGITVTHTQTLNEFRSLGRTGPAKVTRSEEGLSFEGVLEDLTLEEYAKVLNDVTVSSGSNFKEVDLRQGLAVSTFAFLMRIPASAYGDFESQYQIPRVYQGANPAPAFTKDGKAGLAFSFMALEDLNAATESERFGQLVMQESA